MKSVIVAVLILASAASAQAQQADDPIVTIRLRYSQWRAIGALVDEQKIKDFGAIANEVQNQMNAQATAQQKAALEAFEKQIRDKAKAEAEAGEKKEPQ